MASKKIKLPSHFHKTSNLWGLYYIVHGLGLWLGLAYAAYRVYGQSNLSWGIRGPAIVLLCAISGLALNYMGTLGHEGFHGNLNRNKKLSMYMGILFSSLVPFFAVVGYSLNHWKHHLYTNTEKDPDYATFLPRQNAADKMSGPRVLLWHFFLQNIRLIKNPEMVSEYKYPYKAADVRRFSILNLCFLMAATTGYIAFAIHNTELFLFLVAFPYFFTSAYYTIQPYIEHAEVRLEGGDTSRSVTSPFFFAIFLGVNYHNEHHLYPSVQSHKMPALHRFLQSNDASTAAVNLEGSALRAMAIGATKYYS